MSKNKEIFKVAATQATPEFLNRKDTVEKACILIAQAGRDSAKLVAFPEALISGYRDWVWTITNFSGRMNNPATLKGP